MRMDEVARSSGTAAFNQGYHSSYWAQQQLPPGDATAPLHIEVPPVPLPIGDREVLCLGNFPEPTTEEDFAPEFMTG